MEIKRVIIIGLGEVGSSWFKMLSILNMYLIGIDIKEKEK